MRRTVLALTALATTGTLPAHATGVATVTGYGIFSPGLQAIPSGGSVRFTVRGDAAGTSGTGPVTCVVDIDEAGGYAGGVGTGGTADCTGAVTVSATGCTSQRSGMAFTLACPGASVGGTFHFTPRSINPINDYDVTGQVTFG
jgi:hypothetical protein